MRLNTSTPTLFALSSLFCFGSSLPFLSGRSPVLEPPMQRAPYAVVPVDGGPAATDDGSPIAIITKTIVQTPAPVTIEETDKVTLPPATNVYVSTKIIEGPILTQTVLVTITNSPVAKTETATTTATKYAVIDVSPPPVTTVIPPPAASSTPSTTPQAPPPVPNPSTASSIATTPSSSPTEPIPATPTQTTSASTTSSNPVASPTSTSLQSQPSGLTTTSIPSATAPCTETSTSSSSDTVSTSATSYDNGQWHGNTGYPSWSNSTGSPTGSPPAPTLKTRLEAAGEGPSSHGFMAAFKRIISWK
ncbi:uncharacterized protein RAG0_09510 [Rhynchosporium agropyri]|uniref:Uncharacterized protein n=1 Tax=Rhynchosporium agropyri TaxID=914238 RepID=A0A1E1KVT2_9HELO|nr:uncharacterized protein RAG0_09510 [Rhynchosporium agropyri]